MGVALYPRIENADMISVDEISGKALARNLDLLQKLIKKAGHKDLWEYYVPSEDDLDEWGIDKKPTSKWFNPMEGLSLIESMISKFEQHRDQFELPEFLEEDLKAFKSILYRAAGAGLRWNLGMIY